jgi:hypothetical protein
MNEQIHPPIPFSRGAELCKLLALLASPLIVSLFLRFAPEGARPFYPRCFLNAATGLYCPGCGTLRALTALGELDFRTAFLYNPFLFLMAAPLAAYMCVIFLLRAVTGRRIPSILSSYRAALPAAVIIIAVFAARNIFGI